MHTGTAVGFEQAMVRMGAEQRDPLVARVPAIPVEIDPFHRLEPFRRHTVLHRLQPTLGRSPASTEGTLHVRGQAVVDLVERMSEVVLDELGTVPEQRQAAARSQERRSLRHPGVVVDPVPCLRARDECPVGAVTGATRLEVGLLDGPGVGEVRAGDSTHLGARLDREAGQPTRCEGDGGATGAGPDIEGGIDVGLAEQQVVQGSRVVGAVIVVVGGDLTEDQALRTGIGHAASLAPGQDVRVNVLTIGTQGSLRALDGRYRAVFVTQQRRLVSMLEGFTDDQWQSPSRNPDWTVHQTMQHLAGVRLENVRVFDGLSRTWSADFDPNRSPQEDIDTRVGESPSDTIEGYVRANGRFVEHLATRSDSQDRSLMLWGEPADFRLFFQHIFWDSVVHERDMFLPLGVDHDLDGESLIFATAYGLLIAGVAIRMGGEVLSVPLAVDGLGRAELSVTGDAVEVTIDPSGPVDDAYRCTSPGALIDALSGRGEVADVVDGPDEVVVALTGLAAFLRG